MASDRDNYPEYIEKTFRFVIPQGQNPIRLDLFIARAIQNATRNRVKNAIENNCVSVNGIIAKPSRKIQPGDVVEAKMMKPPPIELVPENIPLDIIYEDEWLLVVNKPVGMVVHPAFGNRYGTLVNAILYYFGLRESIPIENFDDDDEDIQESLILVGDALRPGIVHRLDKDTSGLLIISKNPEIHALLASQFSERTISRVYHTLAWGKFENKSGTIEGDIGRSPRNRKLFAVVKKGGKYAATDYQVQAELGFVTYLALKLRTGRTHQIRVHLSSINKPVFADSAYGGNSVVYGGNNPIWKSIASKCLDMAQGQVLHAKELTFYHPVLKQNISLSSDLPEYFQNILALLNEYSKYE